MFLLSTAQTMVDFYNKNFFLPSEHTVWDVVIWGLIFLLFGYFVVLPMLKANKVRIDERFVLGLASYVLLGGFARVLGQGDLGLFSFSGQRFWEIGFWFDSPGMWVFSILLATALLALFIGVKRYSKKKDFDVNKWWGFTGLALLSATLVIVLYAGISTAGFHLIGLANVLVILVIAIAITYAVAKTFQGFKSKLFNTRPNVLAFFAQMLDATGTFIALQFYGYGEQHVIPRLLMNSLGPASFYLLKIPVALLALYYINKEVKDKDIRLALVAFVMIFGLGPGGRTLLRMFFGV